MQFSLLEKALRARVPDGDVWYRELTNRRHITKAGRLHHSALKGRSISMPDPSTFPWKSELSGRLRSIVNSSDDIRAHGEESAAKARAGAQGRGESGNEFQFVGVVHAHPHAVREWTADSCNVVYDPRVKPTKNDFDLAHSLITFKTKPPEGILSALDDIIGGLTLTLESNLPDVPRAECSPCWRYRILRFIFDLLGHK